MECDAISNWFHTVTVENGKEQIHKKREIANQNLQANSFLENTINPLIGAVLLLTTMIGKTDLCLIRFFFPKLPKLGSSWYYKLPVTSRTVLSFDHQHLRQSFCTFQRFGEVWFSYHKANFNRNLPSNMASNAMQIMIREMTFQGLLFLIQSAQHPEPGRSTRVFPRFASGPLFPSPLPLPPVLILRLPDSLKGLLSSK